MTNRPTDLDEAIALARQAAYIVTLAEQQGQPLDVIASLRDISREAERRVGLLVE